MALSSCLHYKFVSGREYETLMFEGPDISVTDLKKEIIQQKKLVGKLMENMDLQILKPQTREAYKSEDLIPKNSSVLVARVPVPRSTKRPQPRPDISAPSTPFKVPESAAADKASKSTDLVNLQATEEEKVQIMMAQSTKDYNPKNFVMRPRYPSGPPPRNYFCHRCGQPGHYISMCPKRDDTDYNQMQRMKRSTGIPNSFMKVVTDIKTPGVLMTSSGQLAVPIIDSIAYKEGKKEKPPFVKSDSPDRNQQDDKHIPGELLCPICNDLLMEAVVIQCCGNSACDECIRNQLLDSDDHTCPLCKESGISPDSLIPNKFMRKAVMNFQNETGYTTLKKKKESEDAAASASAATTAAASAAAASAAAAAAASHQKSETPSHLVGMPPQVIKAAQSEVKSEYHPSVSMNTSMPYRVNPDNSYYDSNHHMNQTPQHQQQQQQVMQMPPGSGGQVMQSRSAPNILTNMGNPNEQHRPYFIRKTFVDDQGRVQQRMLAVQHNPNQPIGQTPTGAPMVPGGRSRMVRVYRVAQPATMQMRHPMQMQQTVRVQMDHSYPPPPINAPPMQSNQGQVSSMPPGMIMHGPPQQIGNPMQPVMTRPTIPPPPINYRGPPMQVPVPRINPDMIRVPPPTQITYPVPSMIPASPVPTVPLTEEEFYREKERLLELERRKKVVDQPVVEPVVKKKSDVFEFAEDIMYRSKTRLVSRSPRSRSRSWSKSNGKSRSRTRSRSGSMKRTPRLRSRSRSPMPLARNNRSKSRSRNKSRSRSRSLRKSRSWSRPMAKSRSRSRPPAKSRSRSRPPLGKSRSRSRPPLRKSRSRSRPLKSRSRSRPPAKSRSRTRSFSRRRSYTPKKSYIPKKSFSPAKRYSRSRSRTPLKRPRSPFRSRSPRPRSRSLTRSRSRSFERRPVSKFPRSMSRSPLPKKRRSKSPSMRARSPPSDSWKKYQSSRRSTSPRRPRDYTPPDHFQFRQPASSTVPHYSPDRYRPSYGTPPQNDDYYRYHQEKMDPRWVEYYHQYKKWYETYGTMMALPPEYAHMKLPTRGRSKSKSRSPRPAKRSRSRSFGDSKKRKPASFTDAKRLIRPKEESQCKRGDVRDGRDARTRSDNKGHAEDDADRVKHYKPFATKPKEDNDRYKQSGEWGREENARYKTSGDKSRMQSDSRRAPDDRHKEELDKYKPVEKNKDDGDRCRRPSVEKGKEDGAKYKPSGEQSKDDVDRYKPSGEKNIKDDVDRYRPSGEKNIDGDKYRPSGDRHKDELERYKPSVEKIKVETDQTRSSSNKNKDEKLRTDVRIKEENEPARSSAERIRELDRARREDVDRPRWEDVERSNRTRHEDIERTRREDIERSRREDIDRMRREDIDRTRREDIERTRQEEADIVKREGERTRREEVDQTRHQEKSKIKDVKDRERKEVELALPVDREDRRRDCDSKDNIPFNGREDLARNDRGIDAARASGLIPAMDDLPANLKNSPKYLETSPKSEDVKLETKPDVNYKLLPADVDATRKSERVTMEADRQSENQNDSAEEMEIKKEVQTEALTAKELKKSKTNVDAGKRLAKSAHPSLEKRKLVKKSQSKKKLAKAEHKLQKKWLLTTEVSQEDILAVNLPEKSKWEREFYESDSDNEIVKANCQHEDDWSKALPRSVIESAERNLQSKRSHGVVKSSSNMRSLPKSSVHRIISNSSLQKHESETLRVKTHKDDKMKSSRKVSVEDAIGYSMKVTVASTKDAMAEDKRFIKGHYQGDDDENRYSDREKEKSKKECKSRRSSKDEQKVRDESKAPKKVEKYHDSGSRRPSESNVPSKDETAKKNAKERKPSMFMDEEKFEPDYDEYSASETEETRKPSKWKETVSDGASNSGVTNSKHLFSAGSRNVDAEEEAEDDETTEVKTKHSKKKHKKEKKKHHKKHKSKGSEREEK